MLRTLNIFTPSCFKVDLERAIKEISFFNVFAFLS